MKPYFESDNNWVMLDHVTNVEYKDNEATLYYMTSSNTVVLTNEAATKFMTVWKQYLDTDLTEEKLTAVQAKQVYESGYKNYMHGTVRPASMPAATALLYEYGVRQATSDVRANRPRVFPTL